MVCTSLKDDKKAAEIANEQSGKSKPWKCLFLPVETKPNSNIGEQSENHMNSLPSPPREGDRKDQSRCPQELLFVDIHVEDNHGHDGIYRTQIDPVTGQINFDTLDYWNWITNRWVPVEDRYLRDVFFNKHAWDFGKAILEEMQKGNDQTKDKEAAE